MDVMFGIDAFMHPTKANLNEGAELQSMISGSNLLIQGGSSHVSTNSRSN
jgi:hypothetical protein